MIEMKYLRVSLVAVLAILVFTGWQTSSNELVEEKYDGMVILHIEGMTDAVHGKMQDAISGQLNIGIEYVCVESGIAVIKFSNSSMAEKGDNEMMVRNKFKGSVPAGMETVYVDVRLQAGTSKC